MVGYFCKLKISQIVQNEGGHEPYNYFVSLIFSKMQNLRNLYPSEISTGMILYMYLYKSYMYMYINLAGTGMYLSIQIVHVHVLV